MNKRCWSLLVKKGQIHKRHSPMGAYTWSHQFWPTGKDTHLSVQTQGVVFKSSYEWMSIGMEGKRESRGSMVPECLNDEEQ